MKPSRRHVLALGACLGATLAAPAFAQPWPAKPITLVVSYPAGGDTDALARMLAEKLATRLGQPVLVDNRPGASGMVGNAIVAKAPADGYTLLLAPSTFSVAPHVLRSNLPGAHVVTEFTPIVLAATTPNLLVAYPGTGIKDVKGLVAAAKGGRSLSYGSPGNGSPMHIAAEIFNRSAGVQITHVAYRGIAPAVTDVLGGHVSIAYVTPGAVSAYLTSGKLLPLAITDAQRSPSLPNVPTLAELGYRDVGITSWWGLLGPKGLPADITRTLNGHLNEILKMPDIVSRMAVLGATPAGGDSARLATEVAHDYERFGKLVKEFGIKAD